MLSDTVPTPSHDAMVSPEPVLPVLIVDDEPAILEMLRAILLEEGFTAVPANNGTAALILLQRTSVALVLTDYMMPGLSGLELADRMRDNPRTAAVPVLLMSAFPPSDAGQRVQAVIRKPFVLDELVHLVRQFSP